jgi:hypothetical protein
VLTRDAFRGLPFLLFWASTLALNASMSSRHGRLMEPAEGYSFTHAKSAIEDADWVSGDHRPEGVIVATGPKVTAFDQQPLLIDLAPTILAALDAPASIKHTGRVLHEIVGSEASVRAGESAPASEAREEERSVTDTEADEMEEHLRGLGYLE